LIVASAGCAMWSFVKQKWLSGLNIMHIPVLVNYCSGIFLET
jgi:hypothetical protein